MGSLRLKLVFLRRRAKYGGGPSDGDRPISVTGKDDDGPKGRGRSKETVTGQKFLHKTLTNTQKTYWQ